MADSKPPELDQLRRENARLIGLLETHGIPWRSGAPAPSEPAPISLQAPVKGPVSTQEKVALFRRLFRGRDDVYALRWQSNSNGRSGYAPACGNEWRQDICEKPQVACRDCQHRELLPLTDAAIYGHLAGDPPLASTPCWGTTAATCWPSTLTTMTGVTTPGPFCARVRSWRCPQRWRSPAPVRVLMCGCSSRRPYRRGRLANWGPP